MIKQLNQKITTLEYEIKSIKDYIDYIKQFEPFEEPQTIENCFKDIIRNEKILKKLKRKREIINSLCKKK